MPELPDVEYFKRYLDSTSLYKKIESIDIKNKKVLGKSTPVAVLEKNLIGDKFTKTFRHGKYLFIQLNQLNQSLMMHFGMTGYLLYSKKSKEKENKHERIRFSFDNHFYLSYISQRMLGKLELIESSKKFIENLGLGPDANEIDKETFKKIIYKHKANIKNLLMNQKYISGIGNIYSDEILFQSRLHPGKKATSLSTEEIRRLYNKMRDVIKIAVRQQADVNKFPDKWLTPHRKKNEKCPICGGKIESKKVSQRTAYFCPGCLKE